MPLQAHKRIQISLPLKPSSKFSVLNSVKENVFPLAWVDEGADIDDENLKKAKGFLVTPFIAVDATMGVMIALGCMMIMGSIVQLVRLRRSQHCWYQLMTHDQPLKYTDHRSWFINSDDSYLTSLYWGKILIEFDFKFWFDLIWFGSCFVCDCLMFYCWQTSSLSWFSWWEDNGEDNMNILISLISFLALSCSDEMNDGDIAAIEDMLNNDGGEKMMNHIDIHEVPHTRMKHR